MPLRNGFSLLEALIVLAMIAILAMSSIPFFNTFIDQTFNEVLQSELLQALSLARQSAMTYGVPVLLCQSQDSLHCAKEGSKGLLIFTDTHILATPSLHTERGDLYVRAYPSYRNELRFLPRGHMRNDNGSFWFCYKNAKNPAWAIMLNSSGKTRVIYPDKKGVIKDTHGGLFSCHDQQALTSPLPVIA